MKAKPPQKEATLQIISALAAKTPRAVGYLLVHLVSPVADLTCDIKKEADGWDRMGWPKNSGRSYGRSEMVDGKRPELMVILVM